jgi:hypothetical protein
MPRKSLSDIVLYGDSEFIEKYGFKPIQIIDYKALAGDASDNIPGVPGIGDVTATKLIQQFSTLESIYQPKNLATLPARTQKLLAEGAESAKMSLQLATIDTNVPVKLDLDKCVIHDFAHTPGGCGGREAKASIGMPAEQVYGITHFIGRHVDHHDVVIQTLLAAEKAAILTDKPVLAVAQNHHNGTFYPLGSFANRGRNMTKSVPTSQFMDHGYDPNLLYSNGLPVISGDEIPEVFDDILDLNSKYLDMVYQRSPDFQTTQQVQNPASNK